MGKSNPNWCPFVTMCRMKLPLYSPNCIPGEDTSFVMGTPPLPMPAAPPHMMPAASPPAFLPAPALHMLDGPPSPDGPPASGAPPNLQGGPPQQHSAPLTSGAPSNQQGGLPQQQQQQGHGGASAVGFGSPLSIRPQQPSHHHPQQPAPQLGQSSEGN